MQQYLQKTVTSNNLTPGGSGSQFPIFNVGTNGSGYPVIAPNSSRKNPTSQNKHKQLISADYSMNVTQSAGTT